MIDLEKVKSVRIAACDLNGQMRGKRLPRFEKEKFKDGSIRMPLSALNVDIFGADIENSPLVFETGDQDGLLKITSRGGHSSSMATKPNGTYTYVNVHRRRSTF